jgi:acyl dehydratase
MIFDYKKLLNWQFDDVEHAYSARDTILYALGLGYGSDPTNESELRFVYEEKLLATPMMAVILGYPGFWLKDERTGVNWKKVLHGEQSVIVHSPLPTSGNMIGRSRVTSIVDKGEKGSLLFSERDIFDKKSGILLATLSQTAVLRGDGGYGGPTGVKLTPHKLPEHTPDIILDIKTLPQAALIYRLSGDLNPLHADPEVAKAVGFDRPILHGLCTFGIAGRAILRACCSNDPLRLNKIHARFSSPVFPGETIRTEMWRNGETISFRARSLERDQVVLNNGLAVTISQGTR